MSLRGGSAEKDGNGRRSSHAGVKPVRPPLFARLRAARRDAHFRTYKPNLYYIRYRIELQERRIEILRGGGLRVLGKYAIVGMNLLCFFALLGVYPRVNSRTGAANLCALEIPFRSFPCKARFPVNLYSKRRRTPYDGNIHDDCHAHKRAALEREQYLP